ncbi:MAG TPA: flagellar biosynthetic protein FliP [Firmicutes bacterium]|jgi:flagellar biosynthetic protein FliP|nr:flagellar biosynthetic protein FliP [Bacillota bacterium]
MNKRRLVIGLLLGLILILFSSEVSLGQPILPNIEIGWNNADDPEQVAASLRILVLITILSLAPAILIMTTAFTRIVVVLSFTRSAIGLQQSPSNQVMIGLALFLTFYVMAPTWSEVRENALTPFFAGEISIEAAVAATEKPVKNFMGKHSRNEDLRLFMKIGEETTRPANYEEIPLHIVAPAFIISELKTAFMMGFILYVPFLVVDMVVASTLMSMGMMMLPPIMISMPFKILLFVMVDGWNLVVRSIITGY